jgi:hypothetical protein
MADYDEWDAMPNGWMQKATSAYDNERELYEVLQMEAFNNFGVQMVYYPISISADKVFGEDNARVIMRRFDFMSYYELPEETKKVSIMGITGEDSIVAYVSVTHFNYVSKFDSFGTSGVYPLYVPKIGDIVSAKYNKEYYVIKMVRAEDNIFLQGKHTYTLQLELYKNKSYRYSDELKQANLIGSDNMFKDLYGSNIKTEESDLFDISKVVNEEKEAVLYKIPDNCPPKDPFNDWWSDK